MSGVIRPIRQHFADTINGQQAAQEAQARQQLIVITDPTGATGDPGHQHATFVMGWLGTICGINHYGAASYRTGAWVQI